MIVSMKKVGIVVQTKDAKDSVRDLASLGVVHVEFTRPPEGKDADSLQADLGLLNEALTVLNQPVFAEGAQAPEKNAEDWKKTAAHIVDCGRRYEHLRDFSVSLLAKIEQWQAWGDFNPDEIHALREKGIFVRLYQVPLRAVKDFPEDVIVRVLFESAGTAFCAVVSENPFESLYKEIDLPKMGLRAMKMRLEEDRLLMEQLVHDIRALLGYRQSLEERKPVLEKNLEFVRAWLGMGQEGGFSCLSGFVPLDAVDKLMAAARKASWAVLVTDPGPDDVVPTLLRNPKWITLIRPLTKLLEITPAYTELDISPLFLVFFGLFFGMLIGDAGYGISYFLLTYLVHRKMGFPPKQQRIFSLLYLLSGCAVVWGILTGTFFGQAWLANFGLKPLVPLLADTKYIQAFCFFIGAFHLTLAHGWRMLIQWPAKSMWAEVGWILVLWASFFLAKMLLLDDPYPSFVNGLIIVGVILVIFFANPQRNIFLTMAAGLGTLALSLMNNFTDVVSYIRLFAVGLAGVAIADAFNTMAGSVASGGGLALAGAVLIVIAGHALNLILGPMSVLVHGVRLNVLEFSGHAGVTWSGVPYKPLKEKED